MESEDSQDAEEKGEEKSESREEEIWREYEIEHGSLEDEAHKRWLKEVMDTLPEEEQEKFKEIIKEKVETIEDFEELARKHGLDELLEDEEVMEEVRNYLKLRSTLENEPDTDIEKLAEEMEIDVELAEECNINKEFISSKWVAVDDLEKRLSAVMNTRNNEEDMRTLIIEIERSIKQDKVKNDG